MKLQLLLGLFVLIVVLGGCTAPAPPSAPQPTLGAQTAIVPPSVTPVAVDPTAPATVPPTAAPVAAEPTAPAPTPAPAVPTADAQLATTPLDAAQRFLAALQADRSGQLAAPYAAGVLAELLRPGTQDVGWIIAEQNPFTGFSVDRLLAESPPYAYVQVTLLYGEPPQPGTTRALTLQQEGDFWRVIEIVLPEGPIGPTPAPNPAP